MMMKIPCFFIIGVVVSLCVARNEESKTYENVQEKFHDLLASIVDVNKKRLNALKAYNKIAYYDTTSRGIRSNGDQDQSIVLLLDNDKSIENMAETAYASNADYDSIFNIPEEDIYMISREEPSLKSYDKVLHKNILNEKDETKMPADIGNDEEELNSFVDLITGANGENENTKSDTVQNDLRTYYKHIHYKPIGNTCNCDSKALRRCRKVCKATLKHVCRKYTCSYKIKRRFKYACSEYCRKAFRNFHS